MQKGKPLTGKILLSLCSSIFLLFSISLITSCKGGKEKAVGMVWPGAPGSFQLKCMVLTKAQMQVWVDSGWTNPMDANRIRELAMLFAVDSVSKISHNMGLIVFPGKSMTEVRLNGKTRLAFDSTCTPLNVTGPAIFGNNALYLSPLHVFDSTGHLTDFDFIRFRPRISGEGYLSFDVEVVKGGIVTTEYTDGTKPCPPYCPPPPVVE